MNLTQKFTEDREIFISEMSDFDFQRPAENNEDVKLPERC